MENPFEDVVEGSFYYDAVAWAVKKGITAGTSATTFSPDNTITRAEAVTFLWRAAGEPEPTSTENPFTDVTENDFFYDAILWAVEKNITVGVTTTTFGPTLACNRAQIVTFLWRYLGEPDAAESNTFTDVEAGAWYEAAVNWAVGAGVTYGVGENLFGVEDSCNRGQAVCFLHRALNP